MARLIIVMAVLFLGAGCSFDVPRPPWVETSLEISPVSRTDYDSSVDAQLATLTRQVSKQLSGLACKDIGILQIVDLDGKEGSFEKYVKDELINRLSRSSKFRVYPMDELVKDEIEEDDSFFYKILSFFKREPVYLAGTTVELPKGIKVGIQITSISSGRVLGTASMIFHKDSSLNALVDMDDIVLVGEEDRNSSKISGYREYLTGKVIKVSDNDYVELIHNVYVLYIKRINYEYGLFTDEESNVEIFLNDDYRVMSVGDMINFSYGAQQFVLSLQRVSDHRALFTFASLTGRNSETGPVSGLDPDVNYHLYVESVGNAQYKYILFSDSAETPLNLKRPPRPIVIPKKVKVYFQS